MKKVIVYQLEQVIIFNITSGETDWQFPDAIHWEKHGTILAKKAEPESGCEKTLDGPIKGCTEWKAFRRHEKQGKDWRKQKDMATKFNTYPCIWFWTRKGEKETLLGEFGEIGMECVHYVVMLCNVDFLMLTDNFPCLPIFSICAVSGNSTNLIEG